MGRDAWQERTCVDRIRERFGIPITEPKQCRAVWWENGPHVDGREWVRRALDAAPRPIDPALEAYALMSLAVLNPGGFDEPVLYRSVELARAGGRRDLRALGTYWLAIELTRRDPEAAEELLNELEDDVRALDDPMLNATWALVSGTIALSRGDIATARFTLERYAAAMGDFRTFIQVGVLGTLVGIEVADGNLGRARVICAEMRAISTRDQLPLQRASSWSLSAAVEVLAADVDAAEALLADARGLVRAVDQPWGNAEIVLIEAACAAERGDATSAVETWSRATALFDGWDDTYRTLIERVLEPLRTELSEDDFRRAWERGSSPREGRARSAAS